MIGRAHHRHPHQVLRVDRESREPLCGPIAEELIEALERMISGDERPVDAVLVSDYAKGVCTPGLLAAVISAAREAGIPVIIDPAATAGDHARTGGVVLGLALVTGTLALLASRDAGTGIETGLVLSSAALAGSARLGGARLAPAAFDAPSRGHAPRKMLQIALIFCLAFAGLLWLAHPGPGPQELAAFTRSVTPASALLLALSAALLVSVPRALCATALCIAALGVVTRFF